MATLWEVTRAASSEVAHTGGAVARVSAVDRPEGIPYRPTEADRPVERIERMSLKTSNHIHYSGPAAELWADETRSQAFAGASAAELTIEDFLPA
jgi:hypothetical protein